MKLMKTNNIILKRNDFLYLFFILITSILLASRINVGDGIEILNKLPLILGILFSGILATLAIILALLSSHELSIISTLDGGYDKYTSFLNNAKSDITIVFMCTVTSIFLYILIKVKLPLSITLIINEYLFFTRIQLFLILGFIGLFLSLFAIYDLIESIFTLTELRYKASERKNNQ